MQPIPDQRAQLEAVVGRFVVEYGQLAELVKLGTIQLVDPEDPAVGSIILDRLSDAQIQECWFRLIKHRNQRRPDVVTAAEEMNRDLSTLRRDRNSNVHVAYIPMVDRDHGGASDLRTATHGRWSVRDGEMVPPVPVDLDGIVELSNRCHAIRTRFINRFVAAGR